MQPERFDFQRIVHGSLFVDRDEDLRVLARAFDGVNFLLIAPRRMGKSSLLRELFERAPKEHVITLAVDVSFTTDETEVAQLIMTALGRAAFGRLERGWLWLLDRLRAVRPALEVDAGTGDLRIVFGAGPPPAATFERALGALEETAQERRCRIVIAIDEFQCLVERDADGSLIRKMRAIVQTQDRVSYIVSGSKAHVLRDLVDGPDRPFWQQLEPYELHGIPVQHFTVLARDVFASRGKTIGDDVLARVGVLCEDNPKRIQELLAGLLARDEAPTVAAVDEVMHGQIAGQRHLLDDLLSQVKEGAQKRLLFGLARDGTAKGVYGADFIARHGLGTGGHVARAAGALQAKGILDGRNHFVDPYLFHYVRSRLV